MAVILERCICIDVGTYRQKLKTQGWAWTGNIVWSAGGEERSSISYRLVTLKDSALLTLHYSIDGQNVSQDVKVAAVPSNLNRGKYWVFLCPVCGRRCKKLHLIHGLFQHRTAMHGVFYKRQARTRSAVFDYMDAHDAICDLSQAANAPYFREHYAGKQTRRAFRMLRKLKKLMPRASEEEGQRILKRNW